MSESNGTGGSINRLERREVRRLEDWLHGNWELVLKNRPTQAMAAEDATKALGFSVSKSNVAAAADVMNLRWPAPQTTGAATRKKRFAMLAEEVREVRRDVRALAVAIRDLYAEVGSVMPSGLREMMNRIDAIEAAAKAAAPRIPGL